MNIIRVISYVSCRTYTRKVNIGIQGKLQISRKSGFNANAEELNHDDLDEFEAEFMNADKFYDIHKREVNSSKEILKNKIVANKYFKEDKDPNFLTSVEKHKIRELHKNDPEEWTVERLSESFPALPKTIKKILKSNWLPESVEKVLHYDTTVVNNWKQFQAGTIPVSPLLREHLQKFKDRKLHLPDKDLLTKTLALSKPELPKPKSKYFSGIIESYLDQNESNQYDNKRLLNDKEMIENTNISKNMVKDDKCKNTFDKKSFMDKETVVKNHDSLTIRDRDPLKNKVSKEKLTLNEFIKRELPKIYERRPEEAITLLHVYKKQFESKNTLASDIKKNIIQSNNIKASKEEVTLDALNTNDSSNAPIVPVETVDTKLYTLDTDIKETIEQSKNIKTSKEEVTLDALNTDDSSHALIFPVETVDINLDTYIKARNSKISEHETYALPIKIPRNIYEKGKTYRVNDCYYDDNGQFLYRVPGVRN